MEAKETHCASSRQPLAPLKHMISLEKWETKQLLAAGILTAKDLCRLDEDNDGLLFQNVAEKEFEIALVEERPSFLKGQTQYTFERPPIKLFKDPDGSLCRASLRTSNMIKEMKEICEPQQRTRLNTPEDLNCHWEDPLPKTGERISAQDLRGVGRNYAVYAMPEWKKNVFGMDCNSSQKSSLPMHEERKNMPIYMLKKSFIRAVENNQVLVVVGEHGSGKTTQIPLVNLIVNWVVRWATKYFLMAQSSHRTIIKFVTDGMLVMELFMDRKLSKYSVVILDEVNVRAVYSDVLFGFLKQLITKRRDLRLIVNCSSNAEEFSDYFFNCKIFTIPSRTFPVEIFYTEQPVIDYLKSTLIRVLKIHLNESEGDILLFLPRPEEVEIMCQCLFEKVPELLIVPAYTANPNEMKSCLLNRPPPGKRKVVVASSVAEAFLSIDGIVYVIDPGFTKQSIYNPKLRLHSIEITPISQESAKHRASQAGHTGHGKCYRLYTQSAFWNEMHQTSIPEIQRTELGMVTLLMKSMGIKNLLEFDFMDPPPCQAVSSALEQLYSLAALDSEGLLTKMGRKMAEFPMEPPLSKMLLVSVHNGSSEVVLTILAMLLAGKVFCRPTNKQSLADRKRALFFKPDGDHLTLLSVYKACGATKFSRSWCYENFVGYDTLQMAEKIKSEFTHIMDRENLDIVSAGKDFAKIRKSIAAGMFFNAARKDPQGGYRTLVDNQPVYIHPSSALFQRQPEWVIYHKLTVTSKVYMKEVTVVDPKWLIELAPRFFKAADSTKMSKRMRYEY